MSAKLENSILIGLLLLIIFSAAAHGIVEPWSVLLLKLLTGAFTFMWVSQWITDKKLTLYIPHTLWPLVGLLSVGVIQSIAWYDKEGQRRSLSFDVEATRDATTMLGTLLVLSLIAVNFLNNPGRLGFFIKFLIAFGSVIAVFGLIQSFSGSRFIYWIRPTEAAPFGPFYNRDHFAGYMELLIPLPIAFIVTGYVRGEKILIYGTAALFMGTAAVFTLSRAGMISILAELLLLGLIGAWRFRRNDAGKTRAGIFKTSGAAAIVLVSIILSVIWFGAEPVINRIATGDPNNSNLGLAQTFHSVRGEIWEDSLNMIRRNPLLGVGLGAYQSAYPLYSSYDGSRGKVGEAHNDYLQILTDAGVVGGSLALWLLFGLFRAFSRSCRRLNLLEASIAIGVGVSLAGLLIHSIFDFNLHLPSHAILFLFLLGVITRLGEAVETNPALSYSHPIATGLNREVLS